MFESDTCMIPKYKDFLGGKRIMLLYNEILNQISEYEEKHKPIS